MSWEPIWQYVFCRRCAKMHVRSVVDILLGARDDGSRHSVDLMKLCHFSTASHVRTDRTVGAGSRCILRVFSRSEPLANAHVALGMSCARRHFDFSVNACATVPLQIVICLYMLI